MILLNILGILLGILFVLGGGCTVIFWTFGLIEGEFGMALPLIIVGGLITWGGVAMIRAIWRRRTPPTPPPGTQV
jgi:hypothetical protein